MDDGGGGVADRPAGSPRRGSVDARDGAGGCHTTHAAAAAGGSELVLKVRYPHHHHTDIFALRSETTLTSVWSQQTLQLSNLFSTKCVQTKSNTGNSRGLGPVLGYAMHSNEGRGGCRGYSIAASLDLLYSQFSTTQCFVSNQRRLLWIIRKITMFLSLPAKWSNMNKRFEPDFIGSFLKNHPQKKPPTSSQRF